MKKKEKKIHSIDFSTIVDILRFRAINQPEKRAFTYLVDGETEEVNLAYVCL